MTGRSDQEARQQARPDAGPNAGGRSTGRRTAESGRVQRGSFATATSVRKMAHFLWILVFDDQHNQIGLMNLQVIVL